MLKVRGLRHSSYALITGAVCMCVRAYVKKCIHSVLFLIPLRVCTCMQMYTPHIVKIKTSLYLFICISSFLGGSREFCWLYLFPPPPFFFKERHQPPVLSPGPLRAIRDKNSPTWPSKQQKHVLFLESILNTYRYCLEGCQV